MSICKVLNASVTYGSTQALIDVDCVCTPGTSTALVGSNGSGKTTLLNLLAGLTKPTKGQVNKPGTTAVSYIGQHQHHHSWMPISAREVLSMSLYKRLGFLRRLTAADRQLLQESAERLEVDNLLSDSFGSLSGGQRQRVLVASAIAAKPSLLLLDEPITGLDPPSQRRIIELIDELTAEGTCVVLSTHHLDEARNCTDVMLLANRVIAAGPTEQTLTADALRQTFGQNVLDDSTSPGAAIIVDHHGHGDHAREAMS